MLQGLITIHSCGLVHADMKGNNLRVSMRPDGTQSHTVITDLGSCQWEGAGGLATHPYIHAVLCSVMTDQHMCGRHTLALLFSQIACHVWQCCRLQ